MFSELKNVITLLVVRAGVRVDQEAIQLALQELDSAQERIELLEARLQKQIEDTGTFDPKERY